MRLTLAFAVLLLAPAACATDDGSGDGDDGGGLASEPPPDGYVRYETPVIELAPGESGLWKTWVAPPMDHDVDILDIRGGQSRGGHHALLYSNTIAREVGETQEWQSTDQFTSALLGGVGGEAGTQTAALPAGAVFRLPAGYALMIQSHYVNATDQPMEGRSYLDVAFAEPSPDRIVAGLFSTADTGVEVLPGETEFDNRCVIGADVQMLMWANHMHEYGKTAVTTLTIDGEDLVLKDDPAWSYEWAANPNFERATVDAPFLIPAGSTLNTHCTWSNTGERSIRFPDEMCLLFGFHLGAGDILCVNGEFSG